MDFIYLFIYFWLECCNFFFFFCGGCSVTMYTIKALNVCENGRWMLKYGAARKLDHLIRHLFRFSSVPALRLNDLVLNEKPEACLGLKIEDIFMGQLSYRTFYCFFI